MMELAQAVSATTYPGRGIVIGCKEDGITAVMAYFIMGRSVNSRNRVFVREGTGIRTQAHDPAKLKDPSLVIYAPVRTLNNHTIVTNGDQTDTIYDSLSKGDTFEAALRTRTFEPDGPNWTPRISGLVTFEPDGFRYKLNILKSNGGNPNACLRFFYEFDTPVAGEGHFLHTYAGDGDPLPSFVGDPEGVRLQGNADEIANTIWAGLNEENRVALFVRTVRPGDGATDTRIINKLV